MQGYNNILNQGVQLKINPFGGFVGLNQIDPQYNLDVGGNINFTGDLYKNGVLFGGGGGSGTVTSVSALTLGTTGIDLNSSVANSTTTPVITLNVPTASATNRGALSSTDWSTFNNKQDQDPLLDEISTLAGNGIIVRQTATTATTRVITGTTNQVTVTNGDGVSGNPTLSLPQNIHTAATPQFARLGLGSAASASTNLLLPASTTTVSSLRIPNGVAPTTPVSGDVWSLTTGLRTQIFDGTNTKDFIFDKANNVFAGFGVGAIVTDNNGNLSVAPAADRTTALVDTKTANYTLVLSDVGSNGVGMIRADATSGNITITLPTAATTSGLEFIIKKIDSSVNTVTISGVSIDGVATKILNTQYSGLKVMSNGTNYSVTGIF